MIRTDRLTAVQVTELAGYTARVSEMLDVFEDVNQGVYRRSADREEEEEELAAGGGGAVQHGQRVCGPLQIRGESCIISCAALHSQTPNRKLKLSRLLCRVQVR